MDEGDMAEEIGSILENTEFFRNFGWKAEGLDLGEVFVTNGDGDKFVLLVTKVDKFPGEDD